jgi:hypothetical protein
MILLPVFSRTRKFDRNLFLFLSAMSITGLVVTSSFQPANAGLEEAKEQITKTMEMLSEIADTGVAVAIVPFGIAFAMSIAGKILSKA